MGHARQHLDHVLKRAQELQAAVVSVEYRLASGHPYPAALDDSRAGTAWIAGHAQQAEDETAWTHVLGARRGTADVPAYAASARAEDLSGLPSTYVEAGSAGRPYPATPG